MNNTNSFAMPRPRPHRWCRRLVPVVSLWVILLALISPAVRAQDRQWLPRLLPAAATNATLVRSLSRWERLDLSIGLPLRNRPAPSHPAPADSGPRHDHRHWLRSLRRLLGQ